MLVTREKQYRKTIFPNIVKEGKLKMHPWKIFLWIFRQTGKWSGIKKSPELYRIQGAGLHELFIVLNKTPTSYYINIIIFTKLLFADMV